MKKDSPENTKNTSSNDNSAVTNERIFQYYQNIKMGKFDSYLSLAEIYEVGYGVTKDFEKAINFRLKYLEEFRKVVPSKFDPILFLIETGNKLFDAGNNIKAGKCYLEASLQLVEQHSANPKELNKALKKYKLESLLKKTGCEDYL